MYKSTAIQVHGHDLSLVKLDMVHSAELNGVQDHVEEIIPDGPFVPQEVPLQPLDAVVHGHVSPE
jgi:hypothetical protein